MLNVLNGESTGKGHCHTLLLVVKNTVQQISTALKVHISSELVNLFLRVNPLGGKSAKCFKINVCWALLIKNVKSWKQIHDHIF